MAVLLMGLPLAGSLVLGGRSEADTRIETVVIDWWRARRWRPGSMSTAPRRT